jgi:hypothetical protein
LGRKINTTIYSRRELAEALSGKKSFIVRVIEQPKIWLIGNESNL